MKKLLLATTAIGSLAAGSAFAAGPTVTIGGFMDFQVGSVSQESDYEDSANDSGLYTSDFRTQTNTEIHIKVDGKTDSGLGYGAHIELEADVNQDDATSSNNNTERAFLYVESALGRVEAGPTTGASDALRVDAGSIARAAGGINGNFWEYIDLDGDATADTASTNFLVLPGLPTTVFAGVSINGVEANRELVDIQTANKISYYSPRVSGIQVGVSYTPDLESRGTSLGFSGGEDTSATSIENIFNGAINYQGQYDAIGIEASLSAEVGENETTTNDDLAAYAVGGSLTYMGATFAGSWQQIDEFGQVSTENQEGNVWTAGVAYEFGPFAASVTYLQSEIENGGPSNTVDTEFTNLSFGADYQLAPGLVPYVEVSFFEAEDGDATTDDNEGSVFIVGTGLSF